MLLRWLSQTEPSMKMLIAYMEGDSSKLDVKGSTLTWHKTVKIPEFVSTTRRVRTACPKLSSIEINF